MATGYSTFNARTAVVTLARSCSNENSGVCTPITTRPESRYFAAQLLMYGCGRSELMQVYVQKDTSTTLPCKEARPRDGELSQPTAPSKSGARPSSDGRTVG